MVFPTHARSRSTACVRVLVGSAVWAAASPAIQFLLDQGRLLKQPQHFGPYHLTTVPHFQRHSSI